MERPEREPDPSRHHELDPQRSPEVGPGIANLPFANLEPLGLEVPTASRLRRWERVVAGDPGQPVAEDLIVDFYRVTFAHLWRGAVGSEIRKRCRHDPFATASELEARISSVQERVLRKILRAQLGLPRCSTNARRHRPASKILHPCAYVRRCAVRADCDAHREARVARSLCAKPERDVAAKLSDELGDPLLLELAVLMARDLGQDTSSISRGSWPLERFAAALQHRFPDDDRVRTGGDVGVLIAAVLDGVARWAGSDERRGRWASVNLAASTGEGRQQADP